MPKKAVLGKRTAERLALISVFGVVATLVTSLLAVPVNVITGIPAGGMFLMIFVMPMMYVLFSFIMPFFPSATAISFVNGALMLFIPAMGPVGFLPKIFMQMGFGFGVDVIMMIFRKRELLAAVISGVVSTPLTVLHMALWFSLLLPQRAAWSFVSLLPYTIPLTLVLGPLGGLTGWRIFYRIRDSPDVRRLTFY